MDMTNTTEKTKVNSWPYDRDIDVFGGHGEHSEWVDFVKAKWYTIVAKIKEPQNGSWTISVYREEEPQQPWQISGAEYGQEIKFDFEIKHETKYIHLTADWSEMEDTVLKLDIDIYGH